MDAVMDLAARAVSFITLIQDTITKGSIASQTDNEKLNLPEIFCTEFASKFKFYIGQCNNIDRSNEDSVNKPTNFEIRSLELVWISRKAPHVAMAVEYTVKLSKALVNWICEQKDGGIFRKLKYCATLPAPYNWREAISEILYKDSSECEKLASVLQYLPIQVVLALGGGSYDAKQQRILQVWKMDAKDKEALLTTDEVNVPEDCKKFDVTEAGILLKSDKELLKKLLSNDAPLPFEIIFKQELNEIVNNRDLRFKERCLTNAIQKPADNLQAFSETNDPFAKAKAMKLYAMAFSGGGIRSATFNLGILQSLAKAGAISKFDYLSTVSGGGYIGSWLAAWIKRDGSVTKVSDRLNPEKSPDPLGEEVRPIRWLRMFSNYFTPEASIMSIDSWTVGMTWLRNTLINQFIILLMFLTVLLTGNSLYHIWADSIIWTDNTVNGQIYWSISLLLPVSLLAGIGMQSYHSESFPPVFIKSERTDKLSRIILWIGVDRIILCLGFLAAYLVSAWLFSTRNYLESDKPFSLYIRNLLLLKPAAIVSFCALLIVAFFGRYDKCMTTSLEVSFKKSIKAWYRIFWTAAIAAIIGAVCLALVWELMERIARAHTRFSPEFYKGFAFTIGLPIVLEVFSITVITRMALLGRYFPDERREWWGRMGAIVHRLAFIWILLASSLLLGLEFFKHTFSQFEWVGPAVAGGWAALVSTTVKAAFSSKTSGKGESTGFLPTFLNVLAKTGPYLFVLGLLIFLPSLLRPLLKLEDKVVNYLTLKEAYPILKYFVPYMFIAVTAYATYILAKRVGINEFSMHHFYRNRLVRAYLGATRRSTERQKTANPFTGFDMEDDVKLSEFKNEYGYYGPYPILSTALNASQVTDLDRQDRKAESFIFSPLYCGFDFSRGRASADVKKKSYDYGFRQTEEYAFNNGPGIGTAMAISGAAANPNQGYHSSSATAFLLTVFNVEMGWWIANPRKSKWKYDNPKADIVYIINNLMGKTNTRNDFVNLSDGGHFDNMGLYELVRRQCSFIILGDGEQDTNFSCEGLANAIRRCRIDFGAEITINIDEITKRNEHHFSVKNYSIGQIRYAGDEEPSGVLLYIKSSITGKEPVDVREYSIKNPTFPDQTTADQFFDEAQFESYRKLGLHIGDLAMKDRKIKETLSQQSSPRLQNGILGNTLRNVLNVVKGIKGFFS